MAETVSAEYEERAEFVKLFPPDGEIDIVAGRPLTEVPWEEINTDGRRIRSVAFRGVSTCELTGQIAEQKTKQ